MASITVGQLEAILSLRDQMSAQLNQAGRKLQDFGAVATRVGAGLTAGVTLPIVGIGTAALKAAADAAEGENLVRESFGGMTEAVTSWSEQVSEAVGANEFKLRESAASMFLLAQNMGAGEQQAFDMATSLTELAGDLDSFLNLSSKGIDPVRALQSGLVGNTEALRSLNVFVNQATLEQVAYEKGIAAVGEELTQTQKFMATYAAIMDQTSKAQGDLARTLDSPTNQMRVMKEQVNQLMIEFGMALLPVLQDVLTIAREHLIPALQGLVEWFTGLDPTTQKVVIVMGALAAALGPVLIVVGQVAAALGALVPLWPALATGVGGATAALGPFAAIVAGIAGGAALGLWLRENSELFRGLTDAVGDAAAGVFEFFRQAEKGTDVTETWTDAQKESLEQFKAMQRELIRTSEATEETTEAFRQMRDRVVGGSYVPEMLEGIRSHFGRLDDVMVRPVRNITRLVEDAFSSMATSVGGIVGDLLGSVGGMLGGFLGSLAGDLIGRAVDWIGGLIRKEEQDVNDLRDAWFAAHGGFVAVQEALMGTAGAVEAGDYVKNIFDAETVDEFNAAIAQTEALLKQQEQGQQEIQQAFEEIGSAGENYTNTLMQQFSALIAKIDELIATLMRIGQVQIPAVHVPVSWDIPSMPGGPGVPEFQYGTGGFRDFGGGTPAILHGVERVQTKAQAAAEDQTAAEVRKLRSDLAELPRAVGRSVRDAIALTGH